MAFQTDKIDTSALIVAGDVSANNIGSLAAFKHWYGTQAQYDGLGSYDTSIYYFVKEE